MTRNAPPSASEAPPITTETFQKHYGRGSGYPADPSRSHHGHPLPPPPPHHYSTPQYPPPPSQHAHSPYPPPGHRGGPSPSHGHGYHHPPSHNQSWYYPPQAPANPAPSAGGPPPDIPGSSSLRRNAPRAANDHHSVPPSLVTPKSHDSETLPATAVDQAKGGSKRPPAKFSNKKANNCKGKGKKEKNHKVAAPNHERESEMEEELKVDPMKQDFHFYAMDRYEEVKRASQQQLEKSLADPTVKENELYLLTTLVNARLIRDWEAAPASTRAEYLKREEADRKRFMGEEEVASRHCATLTARRRSPKQSSGVGRMGSFGLMSANEATAVPSAGLAKRSHGDVVGGAPEGAAKRVKAS